MAMFSKRSLEGVILIDHRNSPGISEEFIRKNNLDAPAVGAGKTFESALVNCHSCSRDVVLNPNRSRDRAYCFIHDAYLCDQCAAAQRAGAVCVPYRERMFRMFTKLMRRQEEKKNRPPQVEKGDQSCRLTLLP